METNTTQEVDPLVLATFIETYMKLLCNKKVVEGIQELINECTNKENTLAKQRTIRKIGKHNKWRGCEMRLAMQIGEYEME